VRKFRLDLPEETWPGNPAEAVAETRRVLSEIMMRRCGIVRDAAGLAAAATKIEELHSSLRPPAHVVDELEVFNLLTVARLVVKSALTREESRGVHLRSDFPDRDDVRWRRHVTLDYDPDSDSTQVRVLERLGGAG
jgi:L-aspartate oxidase